MSGKGQISKQNGRLGLTRSLALSLSRHIYGMFEGDYNPTSNPLLEKTGKPQGLSFEL